MSKGLSSRWDNNEQRATTIRYGVLVICYIVIGIYTIYWARAAFAYGFDFNERYSQVRAAQIGQSAYFPYDPNTSLTYTPLVLVFLSLFAGIDAHTAFTLWTATMLIAYAASIYLVYYMIGGKRTINSARGIFILVVFIAFMPLWEDLQLGQINVLILLALMLCLYFSERDQQIPAGIFLTLAIIPKITPLIFVFYFLALRQFRLLITAAACFGVLALITWLQFGSRVYSDYIAILPIIMSEANSGHYLNLSIVTSVLRVLDVLGIKDLEVTVSLIVKLILGAYAALVIGVRLRVPHRSQQEQKLLNHYLFAILLVVMVIISPRVWFHHELLLIFSIALLLLKPRNNRHFIASVLIVFLLQSERLIYNSVAVVVGKSFPDMLTTALAFVTATPTILAEIALIGVLTYLYMTLLFRPKPENAM